MQPSDRYEALCETAASNSKAYLERRQLRKQVAAATSKVLANYLGMPPDRAKMVAVDENIQSTGPKKDIGLDIDLRRGEDNLWYFGLDLHFESENRAYFGAVTLYIGVDVEDGTFVVKFDKRYKFKELSAPSMASFAEEVYLGLLEDYKKPPNKRRKSIGFVDGP